jgi:APA family basic amino acid/polyamine antiporter
MSNDKQMLEQQEVSLQRHLGLPLVTFYGLGTIIGAGIYVLVSEVARVAGTLMPLAFLGAGIIAALTGLCYAELCSRFPHAAGAALYVDKAFKRASLSQLTGFMVLLTGIVSAATISRGFVGYLDLYWQLDTRLAIIGLCLLMGTITSLGIRESAWAITLITVVEIAGLIFVLSFVTAGQALEQQAEELQLSGLTPIALGAFLAFYAFIGFEDMVNLAEEVREPETNLPRAIILSIAVSSLMYVAIAVAAVYYIDLSELAASASPMALMVGNSPRAVAAIGVIGMVAISNGALTQIIMASRMLYGMARRQLLPAMFGKVNARTQTPVLNTWLVTFTIMGFALWLPVVTLAQLTSFIMLLVFAVVNCALLRVKAQRSGEAPAFTVPGWVPMTGLIANLCLLGYQIWAW